MYRKGRSIYFGENLKNKVYPDGMCYSSEDINDQEKVHLSVLPSKGTIKVIVRRWTDDNKDWIESGAIDEKIATTHKVVDLEPKSWHNVYVNGEFYRTHQSNANGFIWLTYTGSLNNPNIFEVKKVQ